jgi:prevent-host-death family protein
MAGKSIGAAEFKTHCLRILEEVDRSRQPVTITKRGRPIAEVRPIPKQDSKFVFGCMKDSVESFHDPFSPAYEGPWDAEKGSWEPRG